MLKIEQLNQYYGQSHTLWGEPEPCAQWADAAWRTPGREAGLERGYREVSYACLIRGMPRC
jgi:hypothetical protein